VVSLAILRPNTITDGGKMALKGFQGDRFSVLLDNKTQRQIIELAAKNVCRNENGKYKTIAKKLQARCSSLANLKLTSIQCNYFTDWKLGKKFIPIDCLIEFCNLSNYSLNRVENKIEKIKYKHSLNRNAIKYDKREELFNFERELDYLEKNKGSLDFIEYFYGIHKSKNDLEEINNFIEALKHRKDGKTNQEISVILNIPKTKVNRWISERKFPNLIWFLKFFLKMGLPEKNTKWLSINSTKGGIFTGPWIEVPDKISDFRDLIKVINQLKPLPEFYDKIRDFKEYNKLTARINLFAFVLGVLIGDSSKHAIKRKRRVTRRITLRLSKRYKSNERFGEFTSMCINSMGLRMKRRKDCPAGRSNPYPFYTWASQSSPLIQWVFNVCLGMKDHELTTYDSIKSDWIQYTPREFKAFFLQGLAESDGFIDFSSCQAGIITNPNTDFIKKLLDSLDMTSAKRFFSASRLWSLMININDSYRLPLFNPVIQSYRYKKMEKLYKAERVSGHWPEWLRNEINFYIKKGLSGTELVEKIIDKHNILVRAQRVNKKRNSLINGGDFIKKENEMIALGIESTAH
jgi:hypothetical protein